ncbi:uncharacterized protein LOC141680294 [Apium graveolens]|uniref:uncharacterized protein LOC141680294 n=1 Tax=Apium graveolens TaxID=4045 RepID=UPI003D798A7F
MSQESESEWVPDLIFGDKQQVKATVRRYSIVTGKPLKYNVDDNQRIQVICAKGCPFKIWLSYLKEKECWQVKTVNDEHNCIYHYANKLVSVKFLAEVYGNRIRRNPSWKLNEMQQEIKKDLKVEGWKDGCRPALGLDSCFLKTVCGGQLLSAVGRDGNNSIFPIAMAVVETESYSSWGWFLMLLIEDLDFHDGYELTLISDQQKGLDKDFRELLPQVEHIFCARHLSSNLSKKHPSEAVKLAFWVAATSTYPEAFKAMRDLERHSKGAAEKMNELDPKSWYMPLIDMLTDIHDMIMERLHKKRDIMKSVDCVVLPRIKNQLDISIKDSNECRVLWDGRENFQVKWRERGLHENIFSLPRSTKGEPFWEETLGDTILPPSFLKQLRGRPKRQCRREGWEGARGRLEKGGKSSLSKMGRVMHCTICRQRGHKRGKCPNKSADYVEKVPKKGLQRGRT